MDTVCTILGRASSLHLLKEVQECFWRLQNNTIQQRFCQGNKNLLGDKAINLGLWPALLLSLRLQMVLPSASLCVVIQPTRCALERLKKGTGLLSDCCLMLVPVIGRTLFLWSHRVLRQMTVLQEKCWDSATRLPQILMGINSEVLNSLLPCSVFLKAYLL